MNSFLAILTVLTLNGPTPADLAVEWSSRERFLNQIEILSSDNRDYRNEWNDGAVEYAANQFRSWGYEVEFQHFEFEGYELRNVFATRWGTNTEEMYIVSAHIDSASIGTGADDDASGCSLVLETARIFSYLNPEITIRFILFNAEEQSFVGSLAYYESRVDLQGTDEPIWLGMVQFDMILYDHASVPDFDIEYKRRSGGEDAAVELANFLADSMAQFDDTPVQVSDDMCCTDTHYFRDDTGAITIRENRRLFEIGFGTNPHHHEETDVFETYSSEDYDFGFSLVKMFVGALAELTSASVRFNENSWYEFLLSLEENDLEFDLNADNNTDLLDFSIFQRYFG